MDHFLDCNYLLFPPNYSILTFLFYSLNVCTCQYLSGTHFFVDLLWYSFIYKRMLSLAFLLQFILHVFTITIDSLHFVQPSSIFKEDRGWKTEEKEEAIWVHVANGVTKVIPFSICIKVQSFFIVPLGEISSAANALETFIIKRHIDNPKQSRTRNGNYYKPSNINNSGINTRTYTVCKQAFICVCFVFWCFIFVNPNKLLLIWGKCLIKSS